MPIYEFFCPGNNKIYSFFARSLGYSSKVPRCPDDAKLPLERMISNFAFIGKAKEEKPARHPKDEDDPRIQAALESVEQQLGAMDTDNPDPRMVGRMLRKMAEITGETMPGQVDEVMRRLEAGESLDRIEEQFGDSDPSSEDAGGGDDFANPEQEALREIRERLKAVRRGPTRDPVLYEMSEYLDLDAPPAKPRTSKPRRAQKK